MFMERSIIIKKVLARLKSMDYDIVVDFVKRNISKPEELVKYFDDYMKRNKVEKSEKIQILKRLKDENIELNKYPWNKIIQNFQVVF